MKMSLALLIVFASNLALADNADVANFIRRDDVAACLSSLETTTGARLEITTLIRKNSTTIIQGILLADVEGGSVVINNDLVLKMQKSINSAGRSEYSCDLKKESTKK